MLFLRTIKMSLSGVRTFTFSQSSRSTLGGTDSKSRGTDDISVERHERGDGEHTWSTTLGSSRSTSQNDEPRSKIVESLSDSRTAVAIDFRAVRANFLELKPYVKTQKNNLPQKVLSKFLSLLELAKRIVYTEDYAEFMRMAGETFGDTSKAERGSVGHFFRAWALEVSAEKGFDIACSIDRAGTLPSPLNQEAGHCSSYVGLISEHGFTIHYAPPKHVDSLYIHLDKPSDSLTSNAHYGQIVREMKQYNLTKYTLVYPNEEGRSTVGKTFFLPNSKGKDVGGKGKDVDTSKKACPIPSSADDTPKREEDSTWSAWTVIIVLIIVIVFLLAIALFLANDDGWNNSSSVHPSGYNSSASLTVNSGARYEVM